MEGNGADMAAGDVSVSVAGASGVGYASPSASGSGNASPGGSTSASPSATPTAEEGDGGDRRRLSRSNYSVRKKRELIALAQVAGVREVCRAEGVPRRTLRHWLDDAEKINSFAGPDSRKSIGRSGRRELLPFAHELSAFLEDARRNSREMTSAHMIEFIRDRHAQWLAGYLASKKSAESGHAALARLCQRFVERHGFTHATSSAATPAPASVSAPSPPAAPTPASAPVIAPSPSPAVAPATTKTFNFEDANVTLRFGLDIGTTAVKCAVVDQTSGQAVAMAGVAYSDVVVPGRRADEPTAAVRGVQDVNQVLLAVQRAVLSLPAAARARVASVGLCGQMHGILWWCCGAVQAAAARLLDASDAAMLEDTYEPAWSQLVTWEDQRCSPEFLAQCRQQVARGGREGDRRAPSPLAAGYGLATFAHTLEHSPRKLVGMDACGTIQDFVAFVLAGQSLPAAACMDPTDAFSWGGFDLQTQTWDLRAVRALGIPSTMLPSVKPPGSVVGQSAGHVGLGLPHGKPVYVPMGDHPCSVLAALAQRPSSRGADTKLTLVNIGTSAQLAMVLTAEDAAKLTAPHTSFELRPFLFPDRFLGVAASLNGGNTFAWLVQQWQQWAEEMELVPRPEDNDDARAQREADVYARLIALGRQRQDTALRFSPTLNGERAAPDATGSIQRMRMDNWRMGDMSAALCRGLVDNLFAMVPTELQTLASTQDMIGTGNALVRNELLQTFLLKRLAQPSLLTLQSAADAAVGAALAPALL